MSRHAALLCAGISQHCHTGCAMETRSQPGRQGIVASTRLPELPSETRAKRICDCKVEEFLLSSLVSTNQKFLGGYSIMVIVQPSRSIKRSLVYMRFYLTPLYKCDIKHLLDVHLKMNGLSIVTT